VLYIQELTLLTVHMTVPFLNIRRLAPAWVLLAALAWPRSGVAGDAPPAARTSSAAQARFDAGVVAYEEGRFRDAIARFKEADQLSPSPLLSFNIAKVYDRMADNPSALASYRDYLRRLPAAENSIVVRNRIQELEQALKANGVQQVTVMTAPPGASVVIDNVARGVTPWTGELIPGPHTLALRLAGYREAVSEIELPTEHAIDIDLPLVAGSEAEDDRAMAPPVASAEPEASIERAAPEVPTPTPPVDGLTRAPRWWTWAMFGGSAAALVGAGSFELMRAHLEEQAGETEIQIEHRQKFESMQDRQTVARVFLGVGVVAAIAGGVSLYFDLRDTEAPPADVAFDCTQMGCSFAAKGRF
jgi:tetratricopeptide (TPR) repeat protein